ncbi:uncharacterized protein FFNC_15561 [Fusarium fujikuroi]|nr:uncharacterized protein FFNC_15561 [Fusarium fujikuroi]
MIQQPRLTAPVCNWHDRPMEQVVNNPRKLQGIGEMKHCFFFASPFASPFANPFANHPKTYSPSLTVTY